MTGGCLQIMASEADHHPSSKDEGYSGIMSLLEHLLQGTIVSLSWRVSLPSLTNRSYLLSSIRPPSLSQTDPLRNTKGVSGSGNMSVIGDQ